MNIIRLRLAQYTDQDVIDGTIKLPSIYGYLGDGVDEKDFIINGVLTQTDAINAIFVNKTKEAFAVHEELGIVYEHVINLYINDSRLVGGKRLRIEFITNSPTVYELFDRCIPYRVYNIRPKLRHYDENNKPIFLLEVTELK